MKKVVYVEGVTELVFVYNLICTHYVYDGNLFQIHNVNLDPIAGLEIPADFGQPDAPDYYQLVCAGGDGSVISAIKERYRGHIDAGFEIVVGLKDVYGRPYTSLAGHVYDSEKVEKLIGIQKSQLSAEKQASLCFAIMEVEAWMLGMKIFLEREYSNLSLPEGIDPETTYVHPYEDLHTAFNSIGVKFEKHWGDILAVMNKMTKEDFESLYASPDCASFNVFFELVLGTPQDCCYVA